MLQHLKSKTSLPWLCFGDFNEITKPSEKKGGSSRSLSQMVAFQNALLSYGLHEINTSGVKYTWSNNIFDSTYTKEKLDRALATREALASLPRSFCEAFLAIKLDHSPLILTLCKETDQNLKKAYIFKYEATWIS